MMEKKKEKEREREHCSNLAVGYRPACPDTTSSNALPCLTLAVCVSAFVCVYASATLNLHSN